MCKCQCKAGKAKGMSVREQIRFALSGIGLQEKLTLLEILQPLVTQDSRRAIRSTKNFCCVCDSKQRRSTPVKAVKECVLAFRIA